MQVFPSRQFTGFLDGHSGGGAISENIRRREMDLETWTKNQAIRTNQVSDIPFKNKNFIEYLWIFKENAIISQLTAMAPIHRNQLVRDISSGNTSATNELVSHLLNEFSVNSMGNVVFEDALMNNLQRRGNGGLFRGRNDRFLPSRPSQQLNQLFEQPQQTIFPQQKQSEAFGTGRSIFDSPQPQGFNNNDLLSSGLSSYFPIFHRFSFH
jgi:hypothetical protein